MWLTLQQLQMRARYPWTHQLNHILCLTEKMQDWEVSPGDRLSILEILGGLEMDAWIVGRQSPAVHIWATYCRGNDGIETFTGLPRPLLDLISRVSRGEDVSEELESFIYSLSAACTVEIRFWHCFALAAQLKLWHIYPASVDKGDLQRIEQDLTDALRELHIGSATLPVSALAWPAYTLGCLTHCLQTRQLVEEVLSGASKLYEIRGDWNDQGTPLGVMRTYWHEAGVQPQAEGSGRLNDSAFEVGLW